MKPLADSAPCPCGRLGAKQKPVLYGQCCGRFLETDVPAPDAEHLMRSRYCAFVLERGDYLLATWHAEHRPTDIGFDAGVKWLGLDVRDFVEQDADHAEVEFVARQRTANGAHRLHERSRFVREQGRWYYLDGEFQQ